MVSVTFQVSTGFFISPPSIRLIHWWCYFHSTTCDRVLLSSLPTCCLCILVLGLRSALGLHDLNQISRVHCGDFPYSPKHSRCQIIIFLSFNNVPCTVLTERACDRTVCATMKFTLCVDARV